MSGFGIIKISFPNSYSSCFTSSIFSFTFLGLPLFLGTGGSSGFVLMTLLFFSGFSFFFCFFLSVKDSSSLELPSFFFILFLYFLGSFFPSSLVIDEDIFGPFLPGSFRSVLSFFSGRLFGGYSSSFRTFYSLI